MYSSILFEYKNGDIKSLLEINNFTNCLISPRNGKNGGLYSVINNNVVSDDLEDKQIIHIDLNNNALVIKNSWYGEYPLFYYVNEGENILFIHYDLKELVEKLKAHNIKIEMDRIAFIEECIIDVPLRSRTLYKEIKKCIAGQSIEFNLKTMKKQSKVIWNPKFNTKGLEANESTYLKDAKDILSSLLDGYQEELFSNEEVLIPLSGGYDSRLLASLAKQKGVNFNSLVFGPKESNEINVANKIAEELNISLKHTELLDSYYLEYGKDVVEMTGGLSSPMHTHLYAVLKANNIMPKYIVHGFLGGTYTGANQESISKNLSMTEGESIDYVLNKYFVHHTLWSQISEDDKAEIKKDLEEAMQDCCVTNLPCHLAEYIKDMDRQFGLISNVFAPIENFSTIIRPFASRDYANFFSELPYELRVDRYMYQKAGRELFPSVFDIPDQTIPNNIPFAQKLYPNIRKIFLGAYVFGYLATKGKIKIGKSMVYEKHHELLDSELATLLDKSIPFATNAMGINFNQYSKASYTRFKETAVSFRLITLYLLKNNFTKF
ncbi:asparagine synthetase B (glutamine-hydrolyzing) [Bacillus sp. RC242]|uniref:asparagine synthase-related protein n=1 Tax=Bacillus sp. RC242 TaxID=3156286 RepID=UPI003835D416